MKESIDILLMLLPVVFGLLLGFLIIPRFVITTMKDNYGKTPDDIDKTYYSVIKMGGLSLCPTWTLTLIASLLFFYSTNIKLWASPFYNLPTIFLITIGIIALYIIGLKYDLHGISSFIRLITIILISAIFPYIFLSSFNLHGIFGIYELPTWLSSVLIMLISAYIIEMVKLLDGMNGLASGTLSITLLLLLLLCNHSTNVLSVIVIGSALGVILPFWLMKIFSKKWRKVIMGNAGAYTMGFILALAFFNSFTDVNSVNGDSIVIAFSIILLPTLDVLRVIGSRARDSRSIITPDRNQINFKLLRTGIPNGAIFPTYILLIVFFAGFSMLLLNFKINHGLVVVLEIALWIIAELTMNHFIRNREKRTHHKEWNRVYGREVWNANVPHAQIEAKQLQFGSMGLPKHFIDGDEQEFISDTMSDADRFCKRLFDIIVAGMCLILFSPLFLLCYILIKIDDGSQAIFRQKRIGRFGRPFYIYKFRTMNIDAEELKPLLSHAQGEDDPRLTKIGRFLRAHHLDELPQLWNVFRGDMSLVGYRPERKFYIDKIMEHDPRYAFLYQIRPGVTSYATLYNGYTDTMEKMLRRLELDLYYLSHRSWWFDCKILFLTFVSIAFGKKF